MNHYHSLWMNKKYRWQHWMELQSEVQVEDILEAIQYSNTSRDISRRPVVTNTFIVPIQTEGESISLNTLWQTCNRGIARPVWASDIAEAYEVGIRQACPVGSEDRSTTNNAHWRVGLSQCGQQSASSELRWLTVLIESLTVRSLGVYIRSLHHCQHTYPN